MKIYAICLVKNEVDVIRQSLLHASAYCERLYVLDNGSDDGTWEAVVSLSAENENVVPFGRTFVPFDNNLRGIVYDAIHSQLSNEDWWLLLDADEFLAEDPRGVIAEAASIGADVINAWQALFYFTEVDLRAYEAGEDSREKSIVERRRYYRIDEQERRIFQNRVSGDWSQSALLKRRKKCPRRVINRHYRYRDPPQITSRLAVRFGHPAFATQVRTRDYKKLIWPSKRLTFRDDGESWQFTVLGMLAYAKGWPRFIYQRIKKSIANRLTFNARRNNC
jgi:glycosyltransferase involved in cell wall biosynthesis